MSHETIVDGVIQEEKTDGQIMVSKDEQEEDAVFANAEEELDDLGAEPEQAQDTMPAFGTEQWHDYVMRQFHDNELINGAPTCDGCRRILEQLVGIIISTSIDSYIGPSNENKGTATVVVGVEVFITNDTHPAHSRNVKVQEIADVNPANTDAPFNKYPSATAATRAEGRALRKLLRLRGIYTAEEVSRVAEEEDNNDWEPDEPITDSQINVLDMLCGAGRLNISVKDFINSGRKTYGDIREVTKSTAQRMIQELNKIQRQAKKKPPGIKAYVSDWRNSK